MSKLNLLGSDHADSERTFFRNSRITLVVGFGGLLLIMALAGIDALLVLRQFRRSDEEIRQRYLSQNHVLNDIRSDVYVSGTYIRDYLLDPDPERAEVHRTSLESIRGHMESALELYGRQATLPEEIQHYSALQAEIMSYWEILAPIFQWDAAERRRSGFAFSRDEVIPRRQNMLAIADTHAD